MSIQSELGYDIAGTLANRPTAADDGIRRLNTTDGVLEAYDAGRSQWAKPLSLAIATYDFAVDGGAISAITLGITIPDNAIIWDSFIDVVTTLTSATDAATIALSVLSADDIVAAKAISAAGNVWDAGIAAGVPVGTAAAAIKLTSEKIITATIAVEAVTAGKFHVGLIYAVTG